MGPHTNPLLTVFKHELPTKITTTWATHKKMTQIVHAKGVQVRVNVVFRKQDNTWPCFRHDRRVQQVRQALRAHVPTLPLMVLVFLGILRTTPLSDRKARKVVREAFRKAKTLHSAREGRKRVWRIRHKQQERQYDLLKVEAWVEASALENVSTARETLWELCKA